MDIGSLLNDQMLFHSSNFNKYKDKAKKNIHTKIKEIKTSLQKYHQKMRHSSRLKNNLDRFTTSKSTKASEPGKL